MASGSSVESSADVMSPASKANAAGILDRSSNMLSCAVRRCICSSNSMTLAENDFVTDGGAMMSRVEG